MEMSGSQSSNSPISEASPGVCSIREQRWYGPTKSVAGVGACGWRSPQTCALPNLIRIGIGLGAVRGGQALRFVIVGILGETVTGVTGVNILSLSQVRF